MAVAADVFFGEPTKELELAGRDRDEREDDDGVPAARDPRSGRAAAGPRRDGRVGGRGHAPAGAVHDAGGDRPPAALPRDARRGRPERRGRGELARLGAAATRPRPLRRARLHEPEPGPPRPARLDGRVLPGEAAAVHGPAAASGRRRRRRPSGGVGSPTICATCTVRRSSRSAWPRSAEIRPERLEVDATGSRFPRPGSTSRRACAGSSTSRTSSGPSPRGCCSTSTRTRSPRESRASRAFPGASRRSTRASRSPSLVDYAHTPDSLATVLRAARGLGGGRVHRRLRRGWRSRPRQARADGEGRDGPRRRHDRDLRQPALRGAARDHRGRAQGTGVDVEIDPDRRGAIARAISLARAGDVVVIAGKGHEQGQDVGGVVTPFRRPRGRPRGRCAAHPHDPACLRRDRRAPARPARRRRRGRHGDARHGRLARRRPGRPLRRAERRGRLRRGAHVRAARRHSSPTTRRRRSPRSQPRPLEERRARSWRSSGRPGRRRRRTYSARCAQPHAPTIWAERSLNNEVGLPLTVLRLEPDTRDPRHRDGDARHRADSGAMRHREARRGRGPAHRAGASRAPRQRRARGGGERRGDRGPAARRHGGRPGGLRRARAVPDARGRPHTSLRLGRRREPATGSPASVWTARSSSSSSPSRSAISPRTRSRRCTRTPRSGSRSTASTRESPRSASLLARRGDAASGGWVRRERRLQRQPELAARRARAPRRARRAAAALGDPRRDGRARRDGSWYHRELGERRRELAIEVIGVGEAARAYEPAAWAATPARRRDARERVGPGDAVLVKASRAVGLEGIADEITNFARAWSPS